MSTPIQPHSSQPYISESLPKQIVQQPNGQNQNRFVSLGHTPSSENNSKAQTPSRLKRFARRMSIFQPRRPSVSKKQHHRERSQSLTAIASSISEVSNQNAPRFFDELKEEKSVPKQQHRRKRSQSLTTTAPSISGVSSKKAGAAFKQRALSSVTSAAFHSPDEMGPEVSQDSNQNRDEAFKLHALGLTSLASNSPDEAGSEVSQFSDRSPKSFFKTRGTSLSSAASDSIAELKEENAELTVEDLKYFHFFSQSQNTQKAFKQYCADHHCDEFLNFCLEIKEIQTHLDEELVGKKMPKRLRKKEYFVKIHQKYIKDPNAAQANIFAKSQVEKSNATPLNLESQEYDQVDKKFSEIIKKSDENLKHDDIVEILDLYVKLIFKFEKREIWQLNVLQQFISQQQ